MKGRKLLSLTPRDSELFYFLWRHKVCTTMGLKSKFFPNGSPLTAYQRLTMLKKGRFIKTVSDDKLINFGWSLDVRGFETLKELVPRLKEVGYLSENIKHDILVTAALNGEFLINQPSSIEIFTEQELRRYRNDYYPSWVPEDSSHRPDGLWHVTFSDSTQTTALEVELSSKRISDYEFIADYYRANSNVSRVLWIVSTPSLIKTIRKGIELARASTSCDHNFILLEQFLENGWHSLISEGQLKNQMLSAAIGFKLPQDTHNCGTSVLLDTRISPRHPTIYFKPTLSHFIY